MGLMWGRFQENLLLGAFCAEICQFGMLPRALIQVAEEESPWVEELLLEGLSQRDIVVYDMLRRSYVVVSVVVVVGGVRVGIV